jgi:hypothetical protein
VHEIDFLGSVPNTYPKSLSNCRCRSPKPSKDIRAYFAEPRAIKRDKIAGYAAHLLKPYVPPKDRKLRLPDIYEMFEAKKDRA